MSTPIIALAVILSLAALSGAAADSTVAIATRDRAISESETAISAVIDSCSNSEGCKLPPNCSDYSTEDSIGYPTKLPTRRCSVCVIGSVVRATVEIPFKAVLLKGLTPARAEFLSEVGVIDSASLRGLTPCSG